MSNVKPFPLAAAMANCRGGKLDNSEDIALLLTGINDEIQSCSVSPQWELIVAGIPTKHAVLYDVSNYRPDIVFRVAEGYRAAGYYISYAYPAVWSGKLSTLTVCWDPEVLKLFCKKNEADSHVPTHAHVQSLAGLAELPRNGQSVKPRRKRESIPYKCDQTFIEVGDYTKWYKDILYVSGLLGRPLARWSKKDCASYLATALLLASKLRARGVIERTVQVHILFPKGVIYTAIASAANSIMETVDQLSLKCDMRRVLVLNICDFDDDIGADDLSGRSRLMSGLEGFISGNLGPVGDIVDKYCHSNAEGEED